MFSIVQIKLLSGSWDPIVPDQSGVVCYFGLLFPGHKTISSQEDVVQLCGVKWEHLLYIGLADGRKVDAGLECQGMGNHCTQHMPPGRHYTALRGPAQSYAATYNSMRTSASQYGNIRTHAIQSGLMQDSAATTIMTQQEDHAARR
jgi:hypothetical protein